MTTITVLEKLYGSSSPKTFEEIYSSLVNGLNVQLRFAGTTDRGWIKLDVFGDDEAAALSVLDREFGLAPGVLDKLEKFSFMKGKVIFSNKSANDLHVDLVTVSQKVLEATVSEKSLQAQLADGKEVPLKKLVELFCLYDNLPLKIKIYEDANMRSETVKAQLSEMQLSLFHKWIRFRFDRLIILGSIFHDVERAVKLSRLSRDIIKIESLGVLEQVVLCKLGTDAVGLIPKLGRYLKSSVLVPFSPKKIVAVLGSQSF